MASILAWLVRRPLPLPGDAVTYQGRDLPYKGSRLMLQPPTLPIRVSTTTKARALGLPGRWPRGVNYDAAPAMFTPLLVRGMGGQTDSPWRRYRGLLPSRLFPFVRLPEPWDRGGTGHGA